MTLFAWVAVLTLFAVVLVRGIRFRRGTSRALLPLYRNSGLPNVWRNIPLVADILAAGSLLLVTGLGVLVPGRSVLPPPVFQTLVLLMLGLLAAALGALLLLLHSPPKRLTPRWLALEDQRDGFVAPRASFGDHLVLLLGLCSLALALVFFYYAVFIYEPLG